MRVAAGHDRNATTTAGLTLLQLLRQPTQLHLLCSRRGGGEINEEPVVKIDCVAVTQTSRRGGRSSNVLPSQVNRHRC